MSRVVGRWVVGRRDRRGVMGNVYTCIQNDGYLLLIT